MTIKIPFLAMYTHRLRHGCTMVKLCHVDIAEGATVVGEIMQNVKVGLATWLKASVCITAFALGSAAHAQSAANASDPAAEESAEPEITVTGTRVVRDGYNSRPPCRSWGADEIARSATPNVADYVNTLPAVSGSSTPRTTTNQVGAGRQGINSMNLRGIGEVRTLTLLTAAASAEWSITAWSMSANCRSN